MTPPEATDDLEAVAVPTTVGAASLARARTRRVPTVTGLADKADAPAVMTRMPLAPPAPVASYRPCMLSPPPYGGGDIGFHLHGHRRHSRINGQRHRGRDDHLRLKDAAQWPAEPVYRQWCRRGSDRLDAFTYWRNPSTGERRRHSPTWTCRAGRTVERSALGVDAPKGQGDHGEQGLRERRHPECGNVKARPRRHRQALPSAMREVVTYPDAVSSLTADEDLDAWYRGRRHRVV